MGLVRGAVRQYCLGGCSALVVCARRSRPVRGGWCHVPGVVSSPFPPSRPAFPALFVAGRPVWVSLILARWYAIPCGVCVPQTWSGCPSGFPRVSFVCVCARALPASSPPLPPRVGVARAPRAVPVLGAGRALPRGPCPSACPASVPCYVWLASGGGGPVPFPPTWLGAARSLWGGCGRGDPSATPQSALLRAGFARCGDGTRVPEGGRLLPWCGASGVGRSSTPDHSSFRACGRGPLPTGCGCGGCGRGDPSPTPQRAPLRAGFARFGGGTRALWGGASCLGSGRPGLGALPAPTTHPFGRAAGAHYPLAAGAGGAGVGTRHQPHRARSCELALRAVGAA